MRRKSAFQFWRWTPGLLGGERMEKMDPTADLVQSFSNIITQGNSKLMSHSLVTIEYGKHDRNLL